MSNRLIMTAVLVFLGIIIVSLPTVGCDEEKITITTEELREDVAATVDFETWSYNLKESGETSVDIESSVDEDAVKCVVSQVN